MVENPYAVPPASNLPTGGGIPDRVGVEVGGCIPSEDQLQPGTCEGSCNAVNDPEEEQRDGLRNRLLVHRRTLAVPVWCLSSIWRPCRDSDPASGWCRSSSALKIAKRDATAPIAASMLVVTMPTT